MDSTAIHALKQAIRHLYGLEATWLASVPVTEAHEGQTVRTQVQVFAVEHSKASRVYAWSYESDQGGTRRFHAVLGHAA